MTQYPFLYENTKWLTMGHMNEKGCQQVVAVLNELMVECGMEAFSKLVFELKFPP
jgi:formiminotetrahydrofolate cyclodeaminase